LCCFVVEIQLKQPTFGIVLNHVSNTYGGTLAAAGLYGRLVLA